MDDTVSNLRQRLSALGSVSAVGRVHAVDDGVIWVRGLAQGACIGDTLRLFRRSGPLGGEVLRLRDDLVAMLPDGGAEGVAKGDRVAVVGQKPLYPSHAWIGRVLDAHGRPMDGLPPVSGAIAKPYHASPPAAAARRAMGQRLATGLAVFDTLLPLVQGQRIGLFAGSGIGKSRLLAQFATGVQADVVVLALIGERGREVRDFVQDVLGPDGMARSVVVAATSDRSPLERRRCALTAMAVAEYFRDEGAQVLFLADSITRFAEAHREIATAAGELPALRGFPASTAQQIMQLAERAGPGVQGTGDITAVFSVLVAGSDMDEPVADILRGVLDGHIVLDRTIAERGRFPAVDLLRSVSRSLPDAASPQENALIGLVRSLVGAYDRSEAMIKAGLYREGEDTLLDQAVRAYPIIDAFMAERSKVASKDAFQKLALSLRRARVDLPPEPSVPQGGGKALRPTG